MSDAQELKLDEIKAILEALIYVSEEPVKPEELLGVFPKEEEPRVRQALEELLLEFSATPRGVRIIQVAEGYRMHTRPEHDPWIRTLYRMRNRVRLSRAALETLAIIAYRQPITTPEIHAIRGINPMAVIQTLLERGLVKILGRKKVVGKPMMYGTTTEFLVHFGLNHLADLPSLEEFGDLGQAEEGIEEAPTPLLPEAQADDSTALSDPPTGGGTDSQWPGEPPAQVGPVPAPPTDDSE